jgi:hypothetical protein
MILAEVAVVPVQLFSERDVSLALEGNSLRLWNYSTVAQSKMRP